MDCKKALVDANGDFVKAIEYLRKKGQKVAANRPAWNISNIKNSNSLLSLEIGTPHSVSW